MISRSSRGEATLLPGVLQDVGGEKSRDVPRFQAKKQMTLAASVQDTGFKKNKATLCRLRNIVYPPD
jgi:hypothetical protein